MTAPMSVNDMADALEALVGQPIEVEGLLQAVWGGFELRHYPTSRRRARPVDCWLSFGHGSLQPNQLALSRWVGKRVRVHGIVLDPHMPFGHGPAQQSVAIQPYSIQRLTAEERRGDRS